MSVTWGEPLDENYLERLRKAAHPALAPNHHIACPVFVDALPTECTCGLDNLRYGYQGMREALEIAQADLYTEGCNCGDASDLPCALCVVNNTLANFPKR